MLRLSTTKSSIGHRNWKRAGEKEKKITEKGEQPDNQFQFKKTFQDSISQTSITNKCNTKVSPDQTIKISSVDSLFSHPQ